MIQKSTQLHRIRCRIADYRGRGVYSDYSDQYKCIFIHIPKAAGTSVALTLFNRGSRHVTWQEYYVANPKKFANYFKFSFVRNPWDRLVSTYFFLKKGGMNESDARWSRNVLNNYPDFNSFVHSWINEENIQTWIHFIPQYEFICDGNGNIMMDFVGRMENMDVDFSYVAKKLACSENLKKVNVGDRKHYSYYYDTETLEIVRKVYSKDVELFGYTFEGNK
jgi:chondroitin 4-sulfotransferase 11